MLPVGSSAVKSCLLIASNLDRNRLGRTETASQAHPPSPDAQFRASVLNRGRQIHFTVRQSSLSRSILTLNRADASTCPSLLLLIPFPPVSYLIAKSVIYLVIADRSYPRKLAFSYLDELSQEFSRAYGSEVDNVRKPYAFVGFGESLRNSWQQQR